MFTAEVTVDERRLRGTTAARAHQAPSRLALVKPSNPRSLGGHCPELDCVRARLTAATISAVEARAAATGVGAERALIATGVLSEEDYVRALGDSLGIPFEGLDDLARTECPLSDARLIEAPAAGLLPIGHGDELCLVIAPRGEAARRLTIAIGNDPVLANRFRFTTAERLNSFVLRAAGPAIAARACRKLCERFPEMSASPHPAGGLAIAVTLGSLAPMAGCIIAPTIALHVIGGILATVFMAWLGLRFAAAFTATSPSPTSMKAPDETLPVYSVVAALYREAASVDGLLQAIERLDYPKEKLDVIIALEADDLETRAALAACPARLPITVVIVPPGGPRTKPNALNVALGFVRGAFTVVFDAEDRPEPDQLRRALNAFQYGGTDIACVQARLCIDNTADSWLARLFTAEYAGQFDVFLPGLADRHLPLPLGGSSNHFETATLRAIGAWDAYNVTEDADLGMRLARFGYRATMINSTTYEEAPARLGPWLRQRTRWFKGWMQTWLVHMRTPRRLWRELGGAGFMCFQLIVGGNALAALVHPLFLVGLSIMTLTGVPLLTGEALPAFYLVTAVLGYAVPVFLAWLGLRRRGLQREAWVLALTPAHWLLLSLAAWRALYQLVAAPYRWEKTTHGLARHSRRKDEAARALVELEGYLRRLKRRGALTAVGRDGQARGARANINRSIRRHEFRAAAD